MDQLLLTAIFLNNIVDRDTISYIILSKINDFYGNVKGVMDTQEIPRGTCKKKYDVKVYMVVNFISFKQTRSVLQIQVSFLRQDDL